MPFLNGVCRHEQLKLYVDNRRKFLNGVCRHEQSGGIKLFNSRGLAIYPPDSAIPHLHTLKADVQELFQSNRLYTLEQVKQFRKKLGGFNTGLAVKNEYVFMPWFSIHPASVGFKKKNNKGFFYAREIGRRCVFSKKML